MIVVGYNLVHCFSNCCVFNDPKEHPKIKVFFENPIFFSACVFERVKDSKNEKCDAVVNGHCSQIKIFRIFQIFFHE